MLSIRSLRFFFNEEVPEIDTKFKGIYNEFQKKRKNGGEK